MANVNKVLTITIVTIFAFGLIFFIYRLDVSRWQQLSQQTPIPSTKVTKMLANQSPKYFPTGVFFEPDTKFIASYNTEFSDGKVWATRVYESNVPSEKIKSDYENYLKTLSNWTVGKAYSSGNSIFLSASKGKEFLIINISTGGSKNTVSVRFITSQP